jgi:hypothetical protein
LTTTLNPKAADKENQKRNVDPRYNALYPGLYTDETIVWNASVGLNLNYSSVYSPQKRKFKDTLQTATLQANGSVQLSKTWKVQYGFYFDVIKQKISTPSLSFAKDLHCWEMRFDWVPFGELQQYYFTINIKSSTLRDVKYDRRRSYQNY